MAIASSIWGEIEPLVAKGKYQAAIDLLEQELSHCENLEETAQVARKLSHLYLNGLRGEEETAAHYGLMAGRAYVNQGRMAQSVAMVKWLKACSADYKAYELERLISEAFSLPKPQLKHSDDDKPPPTPFQELRAFVTFEHADGDLSRDQWTRLEPKKTTLFSTLRQEEVNRLVQLAAIRELEAGEVLFHEGDKPSAFYIVVEGEMQLESSVGFQKTFTEGEFFGEIALFARSKRTATLKTEKGARLLEFSLSDLRQCFREFPNLEPKIFSFYEVRLFLNVAARSILFRGFTPEEIEGIWDFFTPIHVPAGRVLFAEGEGADRLFFLVKGHVEVSRRNEVIARLGPGQFVGEIGVIRRLPRNARVVAVSDCSLAECRADYFETVVVKFPKLKTVLEELAALRTVVTEVDPDATTREMLVDTRENILD